MKSNKLILQILFVFATLCLQATTISPYINLGELGKSSDLVVFAKATKNYNLEINDLNRYLTKLTVNQIIKGDQLNIGDQIDLMAFRSDTKDMKMAIAGDINLEEGKSYLLFLSKKGNYWVPKVMAYYVFEAVEKDNISYLHPINESKHIEVIERPDGQIADPICTYFKEKLLRHLDQVVNNNVIWDLNSVIAKDFFLNETNERALPTGCVWFALPNSVRWQSSTSVKVYSEDDGDAAYGSSNSATYINNARTAMNTQYTGLGFQSGGTTNYTPNCIGGAAGISSNFFSSCPNGSNSLLIIYNDPCSEVPDLSGCSGTLAMGGLYAFSSTHTWKSETWNNGAYGFVIVNNGTGACQSSGNFTIMITHEMTHACGMDHLDQGPYPNQNMNPYCCNNINTKDKECMNYVYTLNLPVDLLDFKGISSNGSTFLSWTTLVEKNNKGFDIERSFDGINFKKIGFVNGMGDSNKPLFYEFMDNYGVLDQDKAYYRLKQIDQDGNFKFSEIVSISINNLQNDNLFKINPNPTNNNVDIKFLNKLKTNAIISIYDINGKRLIMNEIESLESDYNMDLSQLPKGIFNITLESQNGKILQSSRLIKQ